MSVRNKLLLFGLFMAGGGLALIFRLSANLKLLISGQFFTLIQTGLTNEIGFTIFLVGIAISGVAFLFKDADS
jgi:hypothetical protein